MTKEELIKLWEDPKNWRGKWGCYYCPEDPRVIVPKRRIWGGWTVNFAHAKRAWTTIFLSVILAVAPVFLMAGLGVPIGLAAPLGVVLSLVLIVSLSYHLSEKTHPEALPGIILAVLAVCIPMGWACRAHFYNPWAFPAAIGITLACLFVISRIYAAMEKR